MALKIITVNIPEVYLKYIKELMHWGITPSRSEYVRIAVREQILRDLAMKRSIDEINEPEVDPRLYVKVPNDDGTHKIYNRIGEA